MAVDFHCEQCGCHIVNFALEAPPVNGLCFTCTFLDEYVPDPDERRELRARLDRDAFE